MNTFYYEVKQIDGDYAYLMRLDAPEEPLKLVARALLPAEIMEGTKLIYEWMQYSIWEG
ncbi:MAG: chorismate--pyruvate lyase [Lachnospiraceae bacterium]|nr:chorismate--pyruvate lyase [Lachnospiraceae bacterium]MBQ9122272.1 chorismate--pyruvate lyase [Lachnospiraceae bacterium]